ncbi:adenylate/guanylate cyclase domain-containing protein [Ruegeria sp. HKCCD8929]|uniref:adenylate/guanylate cyclase domain-containing protein n=1 Tax=Ruegeria sp. HKCCD8929 TaxID=2683006 RepID=UPI001488356E|nr:adenylate/guanylate cyclase domain-containing protein [Ruegeria sp. HKCCD8929]
MSLFGKRAEKSVPLPEDPGERRQLTVLFYDVVGSTSLVDNNDPEELRAALNLIHVAARSILSEHGGSLEQIMGDGGIAHFGYPISSEDAALSAVQSALALLDARSGISGAPNIRIGVATGVVVLSDDSGPAVGGRLGAIGAAPISRHVWNPRRASIRHWSASRPTQ